MTSRWASWLVMGLVVLGALAVGASGGRPARTEDERVQAIASEVRCPTCQNLSAAESDAKAAQAVRAEIRTRVRRGESNDQIRSFLVSRFDEEIILKPRTTGIAGLVWALPVVAGAIALVAVVAAFRRWKRQERDAVSEHDRELVERALRS